MDAKFKNFLQQRSLQVAAMSSTKPLEDVHQVTPQYNPQSVTYSLPQELWDALMGSINELKGMIVNLKQDKIDNEYLDRKQVCKILNISDRTFRQFISQKRFPYSQIGRKIFVKAGDINEYMTNIRVAQ